MSVLERARWKPVPNRQARVLRLGRVIVGRAGWEDDEQNPEGRPFAAVCSLPPYTDLGCYATQQEAERAVEVAVDEWFRLALG
jgi:hypothetical protein